MHMMYTFQKLALKNDLCYEKLTRLLMWELGFRSWHLRMIYVTKTHIKCKKLMYLFQKLALKNDLCYCRFKANFSLYLWFQKLALKNDLCYIVVSLTNETASY